MHCSLLTIFIGNELDVKNGVMILKNQSCLSPGFMFFDINELLARLKDTIVQISQTGVNKGTNLLQTKFHCVVI